MWEADHFEHVRIASKTESETTMPHSAVANTNAPSATPQARFGRYWTLAVLTIVGFLAAVDRQAFTVLLVPMQEHLQVSDSAMGLLSGSAFAVAQAVFAIPLAWLADRTNRRNLLAAAVAIWSLATAVSGLMGAFLTLLLARLVVGAAEAAQTPATVSLVSDLFSKTRRGTAFMFGGVGTALGFAFGSYAAGIIADRYDWHVALLVVGLPGLLVAALMFLTVSEPLRTGSQNINASVIQSASIRQQMKQCFAIPTLPPFIVAYVAMMASYVGWIVWFPAFLMRVHGLSSSKMGAVFGVIILCSVVSAMWGGPVSDIIARRGARWRVYFLMIVTSISIPFLFASTLVPTLTMTLILNITYALLSGCLVPVATAAYSSFSPPTKRAFIAAIIYLCGALFGSGTAPLIFGLINDALTPSLGSEAVRYTLLLSPVLLIVSAFFFWVASRTADDDTAAADNA
ncbi:hypothetical protein C1T17_02760 [Sphingobium sp. SCG-1]|uniref:MFS transporter n=1 Tax=Sphingobium sp. SCG-1 TaxID=2072936 RepID=UPI000CD68C7F|nr:MFS transporter [Sphingobium sp. SCG-1]AUW57167.1 hypothetical protein C1T17_02760 [Sphingobium sp. SCG-1]